ncbi:MAG: UvrD-helicase domain-containing protein [Crocinitomicaceae bacterium]|nr:UvrD-helicase domain-containing protein [Crocinitomicaceae bacterium]
MSISAQNHVKPFKIFNASAGSGKTYHLVKEYIELLIGDERKPDAFSGIIAMTFTNKAALEMKERIISALDQIGSPEHFDNKAAVLTLDISSTLGISKEEVIRRCSKSLKLILHSYEDFHVMTIDKFNLRLIKSFGRDLDLPAEFEVVLDESELIELIVDDILNQLGEAGNQTLNKLIFEYAKSNVDEGKSWNFKRELIKFGGILNSEKNNAIVARLLEMDFSEEQYGRLIQRKKQIDEQFLARVSVLKSVFENSEIDKTSLHGGGHSISDVAKVAKYESFPAQNQLIGPRLSKNMDLEDTGKKLFPQEWRRELLSIQDYWAQHLEEYASLALFLRNFFNMALLQYMAGALNRVKKDEQLIRISEFNTLISELIQNENAPFIYERLGTRFQHFLLDEFQDTSRLQFLNLVPLIHNSISEEHSNLIVGDPKQSIYRFKNGVAEQFVALPEIYNPEGEPNITLQSNYFNQMGEVFPLENNWRSSPLIVNWNNAFFGEMRNKLPEISTSFYNSVSQEPKSSLNGRVRIISKEQETKADELIPILKTWIDECIADGFNPGDISILGSTNRICNTWALGLTNLGYKIVSSDSLLINTNLRVQLTIAFLHRRLKPSGTAETKQFAEIFFRVNDQSFNDYISYIQEHVSDKGKTYRAFNDNQFLSDHFGGYNEFFFKYEGLYDCIQSFYRLMKYDELQDPYLHHLADHAFEFGQKRGPDLKLFLEDYASKKNKIAVQIPESNDAVKIMTLHKSKGLEFPVVILPSLDLKLDNSSEFLLETGDYVVYKQPAKKDVLDVLREAKIQEEQQILTDNVNVCYVGMTRPMERLYIHNAFDKKKFGRHFHEVLEKMPDVKNTDGTLEVDLNSGQRISKQDSEEEIDTSFVPESIQDRLWFPHISLQDNEALGDGDYLSPEMQFGIQFHLLISRIQKEDDIASEVEVGIKSGDVSVEFKDSLIEKLHDLFNQKEYRALFDDAVSVLSEQEFIVSEEKTLRPDRIILKKDSTLIVDYKTGIPNTKDEKQVMEYALVLGEMKYPNVEGYLFYVGDGVLRRVV